MTFANIITLLLAFWFIYLGLNKGTEFYWTGYLHVVSKERRGPAIPAWIGRPLFLGVAGWLIYRFIHIVISK